MRRHEAMLAVTLLIALASPVHAQPPRRSVPARPDPARGRTLTLVLDGGVSLAPRRITQAFAVPINAEDAPIDASLSTTASPLVEAGARIQFAPRATIGAVGFFSSGTTRGPVDAQVPHPFYFGQPRAVSGEASGLTHREMGVHVEVGYGLSIGSRPIRVFGGPSFIRLEQALVTGVEYTDAYPYDTARFDAATTAVAARGAAGFNVGAETAWRAGRSYDVAATVRYSRATVALSTAAATAEVSAGGLQVAAGVRLHF